MYKYSALFPKSIFARTLTFGFRLTVEIYTAMKAIPVVVVGLKKKGLEVQLAISCFLAF
jgi:hypothetical protein